jgi:hypothetical protein
MKLRHRNAHFRIWLVLAVLLGAGFTAGLALKQKVPVEPGSLSGEGN